MEDESLDKIKSLSISVVWMRRGIKLKFEANF
jgi:hypothetical protein